MLDEILGRLKAEAETIRAYGNHGVANRLHAIAVAVESFFKTECATTLQEAKTELDAPPADGMTAPTPPKGTPIEEPTVTPDAAAQANPTYPKEPQKPAESETPAVAPEIVTDAPAADAPKAGNGK